MRAESRIRVLIVDDHPLVRIGMATVINQQPDLAVVGEAENGAQAVELFRRHRPDVVLMDMRLPGTSGPKVSAALREIASGVAILFISNYDGDEDIHQALAAGANGYLFKSIVEEELIDAIREVHAGRRYLPRGVAAQLGKSEPAARLTRREEEILDLLGKGLHNREIGEVLGVSEDTIKTHLKSLFRKLEVSDRAEAVREAIRRGFIHAN